MGVREPMRTWKTVHADSRVWSRFERRPGDVIISTPPKSGTTMMQGIVWALLWADGDAPADPWEVGPWLDERLPPESDRCAQLAEQQHRRFLKTHSPADAIPIDDDCRYIVVYRDLRDVVMSWANHRVAMRPEFIEFMNQAAAVDGVEPLDAVWDGDYDRIIDELDREFDVTGHLASWWQLRERRGVLFVHFNDLRTDLDGEMRRIAAFVGAAVPDDHWDETVRRCSIDAMRELGRANEEIAIVFDGGADAFFHLGTNRRWEGVLSDLQLGRLADMVATLPPDAAAWLERGSLELGTRP
jgi:aryl sulfotransferase